MKDLVGAWVHGLANGYNGGSHDMWLVFGANGFGSFISEGWWLYRFESFLWHSCSKARTFRVVQPWCCYDDPQLNAGSDVWLAAGAYRYEIRVKSEGGPPSLIVSLPGWQPDFDFLLQSRDPLQLSGYLELPTWNPKPIGTG